MRVITEEMFNNINPNMYSSHLDIYDDIAILLQEIDTLTVSKLRPMSEVPVDEFVLCLTKETKLFECMVKRPNFNWMTDDNDDWSFKFDELLGWLPMIVYKPGVE